MSDATSTESTGYTDHQLRELVAHLSVRTTSLQETGKPIVAEAGAIEEDLRRLILELTRRLDQLGGWLSALGTMVEEQIGDAGNGKPEQRERGSKRRSKVSKKAG